MIGDYERALRELEHLQQELQAAREGVAEQNGPTETVSQGVERILVTTQRIADEIENCAKSDAARLLAEASARAAELVGEAEHRAAAIVQEAWSEAARLGERVTAMRTHYAELRAGLEFAAHTAAGALGELVARTPESRHASQELERVRG